MMDEKPDLAMLQEALERATAEYIDAKRSEEIARSASTAALNAVNQAQRALDAALDRLRKSAQYGTDWAETRNAVGLREERS